MKCLPVIATIIAAIVCWQYPLAPHEEPKDRIVAALSGLKPKDIPALTQKAQAGEVETQLILGEAYLQGMAVERNATKGAEWVRRAADQGHAGAQNEMGRCYALGEGVRKDDAEAVRWYRLSAEQGFSTAQHNLAIWYANGQGGVAKDFAEAMKWYVKAAEQGNHQSQFNLAIMYTRGQGVPVDYVQAYTWVSVAYWVVPGRKRALYPEMEELARKMTKEQIAEAERRATEWVKAHQDTILSAQVSAPLEKRVTPGQAAAWEGFTSKLGFEVIWVKQNKGGSYYALVREIREDSLVVDEFSKLQKRDPDARREIKREEINEIWDIDILSNRAGTFSPTRGRKLYERKN